MYGSNKNTEEKSYPVVGTVTNPTISGNSIEGFELSEDGNRFTITFKQPNGSLVKHSEFNNEADWAQDETSRRIRHIATKIVSDDDYSAAISETSSFGDFMSKVTNLIGNKHIGLMFNMLYVYNKKGYVSLPKYPNFIEKDGTSPSTINLSAYNQKLLVKPEITSSPSEVLNDMPF